MQINDEQMHSVNHSQSSIQMIKTVVHLLSIRLFSQSQDQINVFLHLLFVNHERLLIK